MVLSSFIICELCGLVCSMQVPASHLRAAHHMTTKEYRALGYPTLSSARLDQLRNGMVLKDRHHLNYGKDHPGYKGGHVNGQGYRLISVKGKRLVEHRYVASQMLGRPLTPDEIVHHKDGNRRNNSPDNLQVMTKKEHAQLDANSKKFWHIHSETEEAARLLFSLGWTRTKISIAMRVDFRTVKRWLGEGDGH
jgi:HNH endonuclease